MPSFKRLKSGIQVIFDIPSENGTRKQKKLSGYKNRPEANLAYIAFMANYKPEVSSSPKFSFAIDCNNYLLDLKDRIKESSYVSIKNTFKLHIEPFFNDYNTSDIDNKALKDWIKYLKNKNVSKNPDIVKNLSHSSIKKIKGMFHNFFVYLIDNKLITDNPLNNYKLQKDDKIQEEMLIWSDSEFMQFINSVDDIIYKTFFSFLYLTGCRRGEALALNWKDIVEFYVNINKTLGYHTEEGGYSITTPKNNYSVRKIVIPAVLKRMLQSLQDYYKQHESFSLNNFIFGNIKTLPPQTIRRRLEYYCIKANVKKIRIHDFRHSHASYLISKGYDIVTISRRLGHANPEITLNNYAHLLPDKQIELMASLNLEI